MARSPHRARSDARASPRPAPCGFRPHPRAPHALGPRAHLAQSTASARRAQFIDYKTKAPIKVAEAYAPNVLDSRLPDEMWKEMKYIDVRNEARSQ